VSGQLKSKRANRGAGAKEIQWGFLLLLRTAGTWRIGLIARTLQPLLPALVIA